MLGEATTEFSRRDTAPLDLRGFAFGLLVFAAYFFGARIGSALTFHPNPVAVVWPANGILLAFLLLAPKRYWWFMVPAVIAAHFLAQAPRHIPIWRLSWQVSFNILLCISGAGILRRFNNPQLKFARLPEAILYLSVTGAITAILSPLTPVFVLSLLAQKPSEVTGESVTIWVAWRQVFLSSFLAFLLVTPPILLFTGIINSRPTGRDIWRLTELILLSVGLSTVFLGFAQGHTNPATLPALLYAPLPFLLWATVRFGPTGASTSSLALAFVSIWLAVRGHAPFGAPSEGAISLQLFLVVISVPLLFLAAAIEERKRAQEQFTKAFRSGPDAMLIKRRRDARILDVNPQWLKLFGFQRQEAVGRTVSELRIDLSEHDLVELNRAPEERDLPENLEATLRTRSGSPRHCLLSAQRVELAGEECLIITARDITTRKKAEEILRESEELNRVIIESLLSLVVIVDRAGTVIATNDAWRRQHDAPSTAPIPGIALGTNYFDLCRAPAHAGDRLVEEIVAGTEAVLIGKKTEFRCIYRYSAPSAPVWFEMTVLPLRRKAGGAVITYNNITDRKNAEESSRNLAHVSRLAVVGELTATIAHEINQPLGAILSNADAAEMLLESSFPPIEELRKILADIRKDDIRASEIIHHIRSLLRKREILMEPLEVNETASEVVRLVSADARLRGTPIQTEFTAGPTPVRGDRLHLQQVLLNLILNAIEAMADLPDSARHLTIRTERKPDHTIEVSVIDTGSGIPAEKLSLLFETFFTTKENGMGLGLAIVRSIIEAHNGRITVENNVKGGATFRFNLPFSGDAV
jgi:PAS domain S-box-containing protein